MKVFLEGETAHEFMSMGIRLEPGVNEVSDDQGKKLLLLKAVRRVRPDEAKTDEKPEPAPAATSAEKKR